MTNLPEPIEREELAGRVPAAEYLDIPAESLELTLMAARPALELDELRGLRTDQFDPTIWIANGNYNWQEIKEGRLRSTDGNWPTVNIERPSKHVDSVLPNTIWGRTKDEVEAKIADQREVQAVRDAFVEQSPLGEAGLLLENTFGGIDPGDPERTAKHLVVRAMIARQARLPDLKGLVQAGLLHPTLGEVYGDEIASYMRDANTFLEAFEKLPESVRDAAAPALLEGALELGRQFVGRNGEGLSMIGYMAKYPRLVARVIALEPYSPSAYVSNSKLNLKLPFGE